MSAKKPSNGEGFPRRVRFEGAEVIISKRGNGLFALAWREEGRRRTTTRTDFSTALDWAESKARELAAGSGGRQWIKPGEAEAVEGLRATAGEAGLGGLLWTLRGIVAELGSLDRLGEAAAYFVSHGPAGIREVGFFAAVDLVEAEYHESPKATRSTMATAARGMKREITDCSLLEITREKLELWIFEAGSSKRTARNRLSQAATFFARFVVLGLWPVSRPIPTGAIKAPRLNDVAPGIFSPNEMSRFLAAVKKDLPQYLPYLLLAGWLGCRPSECLRLRRDAFDFENGFLYLAPAVVGKTNRERWVPIAESLRPGLAAVVGRSTAAGEAVCLKASREKLSVLARKMGFLWPPDVLRHSAISYWLQRAGNDCNQVAEWCGNSPKVIRSNYRRPIPDGWGEKWLALGAEIQ